MVHLSVSYSYLCLKVMLSYTCELPDTSIRYTYPKENLTIVTKRKKSWVSLFLFSLETKLFPAVRVYC